MGFAHMGSVQRQVVKWVIRVVSYPKLSLALCAVALVLAVGLAATRLRLSTDQEELMTPKLKFFRDYKEFTRRFPENESYVVILEPEHPALRPPARRWIELADRMTAGLMALKEDVRRVDARVAPEDLGEQALVFADWEEVRTQNAHVDEMLQLAQIVGNPDSLQAQVIGFGTGGNMTRRLFRALAAGPAKDARGLAVEVMGTLASAVEVPVEEWGRGIAAGAGQVPSLVHADPRAEMDPYVSGYFMLKDETKRGTPAYQIEDHGDQRLRQAHLFLAQRRDRAAGTYPCSG